MRLFIRTEASNAVGMGHFMRCFAIAEAARTQGVEVTFLMTAMNEAVEQRCSKVGAGYRLADFPIGSTADYDLYKSLDMDRLRDWVIVDSYNVDYLDLRPLWDGWAHLLIVDDLAKPANIRCDLILNPALSAFDMGYGTSLYGFQQALLGPDYALIRREFTQNYPPTDEPFIAVLFGGSDPNQLTGRSAQMLNDALHGVTVKVIAGPAHIHTDALRALAQARRDIQLYVDPPSVAAVLAGASLVVSAAGGSVGEMAAMGLPALALVVYDNQAAALQQCPYPVIDIRQGLPDDLGWKAKALYDDAALRAEIARAAHALVDGKGAQRVLEAMKSV
jgi:UDP-2,4-diacetamido-2,4,6-trideoxy-beta-L-altropyranose hydrolase